MTDATKNRSWQLYLIHLKKLHQTLFYMCAPLIPYYVLNIILNDLCDYPILEKFVLMGELTNLDRGCMKFEFAYHNVNTYLDQVS